MAPRPQAAAPKRNSPLPGKPLTLKAHTMVDFSRWSPTLNFTCARGEFRFGAAAKGRGAKAKLSAACTISMRELVVFTFSSNAHEVHCFDLTACACDAYARTHTPVAALLCQRSFINESFQSNLCRTAAVARTEFDLPGRARITNAHTKNDVYHGELLLVVTQLKLHLPW